jgi:hypothetical protein
MNVQFFAVARQHPEQALYAAVIQRAVTDAQGGDTDAVAWLRSSACLWYVERITPAGLDGHTIQRRLLERLETYSEIGGSASTGQRAIPNLGEGDVAKITNIGDSGKNLSRGDLGQEKCEAVSPGWSEHANKT